MTDTRLLGPQRLVDVNRARIVMALCQHGPLSRTELARLSGVTKTTIGSYVEALVDEGTLEETVTPAPDGIRGRPPRPVWFHPHAGRCGALALQAGRLNAGVVNARGEVLAQDAITIRRSTSASALADAAASLLDGIGAFDPDVTGIGVAVAGAVDVEGQRVLRSARLPKLEGTAFVDRLRSVVRPHVTIDNDARAGAIAERWYGLGRSHPTFWAVQIGVGIGAAAVIDGTVHRGRFGAAGELGHTTVSAGDHSCVCGRVGCWETVASLDWLRRVATARGITSRRALTVPQLLTLAAEGVEGATSLVAEYAEHIALGLTNLVHSMSPELIILQGEIVSGGAALLEQIRSSVSQQSLAYLRDATRIVFSSLGDARLLGAGALVLAEAWAVRP